MKLPLTSALAIATLTACGPLWGLELGDVQVTRGADGLVTTIATVQCSASGIGAACPDNNEPLCADTLVFTEADAQLWCVPEAPGATTNDLVTPQGNHAALASARACKNETIPANETTSFTMVSSQAVPATGYTTVVYTESRHSRCEIVAIPQ